MELKPCPFCGGEPRLIIQNRTVIKGIVMRNCYVHCLNCDARGERFLEGETMQEKSYPHEDSNALAWRLGAKAMANQIYRDIKAFPTIIPAEPSKEENKCKSGNM